MFNEIAELPVVTMSDDEIREIIGTGKFVSVGFIKADGSKRILTGRSGVKKNLKGGTLGYSREVTRTLGLYEGANEEYRSIRIDRIVYFKAEKKVYRLQ
jgi:hypothetical protein